MERQTRLHQTQCRCPVRRTYYGYLCGLLWQPLSDNPLIFLIGAVVMNIQHNGAYFATACWFYWHGAESPMCMSNTNSLSPVLFVVVVTDYI